VSFNPTALRSRREALSLVENELRWRPVSARPHSSDGRRARPSLTPHTLPRSAPCSSASRATSSRRGLTVRLPEDLSSLIERSRATKVEWRPSDRTIASPAAARPVREPASPQRRCVMSPGKQLPPAGDEGHLPETNGLSSSEDQKIIGVMAAQAGALWWASQGHPVIPLWWPKFIDGEPRCACGKPPPRSVPTRKAPSRFVRSSRHQRRHD
jgi:hypothetical protein